MDFRGRELLLLLIWSIFAPKENAAERGGSSSLPFDENICTFFDYTKLIDDLLFTQNSKPLVIIIADNMMNGIQRAKDLTKDRRIKNRESDDNFHNSQFHDKMIEKIYLYESRDIFYFVYPVNVKNDLVTTYCQRKLINNSFGVMFHFLNSINQFPFTEEIFIPLKPQLMWTKPCPFIEYVNKKMQTGENFIELFELRERLFAEGAREHFHIKKLEKNDVSLFYENSFAQNESSLTYFHTLLEEIQNSSHSLKDREGTFVEKSINCFKSRCLENADFHFLKDSFSATHVRNLLIVTDYLNLLNLTILSLNSSDASFGNLCNMFHYSEVIKVFCFIKDLSDATSQNIEAWMSNLKLFVSNSLMRLLSWLNRSVALYKKQFYLTEEFIGTEENELFKQTFNFDKGYKTWFQNILIFVLNQMREKKVEHLFETFEDITVFYDHWETIDDLLFEVKINKLVIILTDDVAKGIHVLEKMLMVDKRVKPKKNRNDLPYTEQFLYDILVTNFYLFQSNDTFYYVYPTQLQNDILLYYLHFMVFKDYSKTTFHVVKFGNSFSLEGDSSFTDIVIPAIQNVNCIQLSPYTTNLPQIFLQYDFLYKQIYLYTKNNFHNYAVNSNNLSLLLAYDDVCERSAKTASNIKEIFYSLSKEPSASVQDYISNCLSNFSIENLETRNKVFINITNIDDVLKFQRTMKTVYSIIMSIKENDDSPALCNFKEKFKLLKLFCFLKNNYPISELYTIKYSSESILKILDLIRILKNFFSIFLERINNWMTKLVNIYYNVYVWEKTKILLKLQNVYNKIPNVSKEHEDLLKKMFFIVNKKVVSLNASSCPCSCIFLGNEKYKFQIEADVININEFFKKALCPGDVKVYEFLALDKIIFDKKFDAVGKELEIIVIAPIWKVSGKIKLNLVGINNEIRNSSLTGRQGGTFFGIYENFEIPEGNYLNIDVSSGYDMNGKSILLSFNNNQSFKFTTKLKIKPFMTRNVQKRISYHSSDVVKRYKKFVLTSMLKYNNSDYRFLYTNLSNNSEILNDYTTMDIIDELCDLEKFYLQDNQRLDSLLMYKVYKKGIIYKIINIKKDNDSDVNDDQTIQHLHTFYTRKIKNLEEKFYLKPILHINDYLKYILSDANSIKNLDILNRFQIIVKNFVKQFKEEIAEAERSLIDVNKHVKEKNDELNEQIEKINAEINQLHEQKKNESLELKRNEILLGQNKIVKSICGGVKMVGALMSLFHPFLAVGGAVILAGTTAIESQIVKPVDDVVHIEIPNTINEKLRESNINRQATNKFANIILPSTMAKNLKDHIKNYDDMRKQPVAGVEAVYRETNKDYMKKVLSDIQPELNECSTKKEKGECEIKVIKKHKDKFSIMGSYQQQKHISKMHKLNKVPIGAEHAQLGVDVLNDFTKTNSLQDEFSRRANASDQELESLMKFNEEVENTLKPKIENLRSIFNSFTDGFVNATTTTFLEFEKWKVEEELTKYFTELKSWVKDLQIAEEFTDILNSLDFAIQTTIKFQILIKEFKSKIDHAEYMENLVAAPFHEIFTSDPNLGAAYTRLSYFYYANQILDEYNKWLISFKQYTFPCMNYYPEIKEIYYLDTKSPVVRATTIIQAMKSVNKHLNKIEAEGYSAFVDFRIGNFGNGTRHPPFYEWNSDAHRATIKDLLDGKQVKLFANISHFDKHNAVKFRDIKLLITSNKDEEGLRRDLSNVPLTLIHNGDNYYRCDDNIHLIRSGVLQLNFDTMDSTADQFLDSEKNDYVLSPFATWTVQLVLTNQNESVKSLAKYVDHVNVKLIGYGKFMRMNMRICEDDLWIYYGKRQKNLEALP